MNTRDIRELLQKHNNRMSARSLVELLGSPERFDEFSCSDLGMLLDYSRVRIDAEAMAQLLSLARASGLESAREALFRGEHVNRTEDRPALHMALRSRPLLQSLPFDDVSKVDASIDRMFELATAFRNGHLPGHPNSRVRHILHVGIGGSLLGPKLLCDAFPADPGEAPSVHFLGSVDAHERESLLDRLDPEETVAILVSKSFSTGDTLMHGRRIAAWMKNAMDDAEVSARTFAVTSNEAAASRSGIPAVNQFYLPSWVGGRFSIWSPVSLSAAAVMGKAAFQAFLDGAAEMDRHFRERPFEQNLPVISALIDDWHRNAGGLGSLGVIAYDSRLALLPSFLQQLIMESNGKSVSQDGESIDVATSPVVFGEPGTDAQHSIFQALHQGSTVVPLDVIGVIRPDHDDREAQAHLLANLLAQITALAVGRSAEETRAQMRAEKNGLREDLVAHRVMPGNRPSQVIMLDDFGPAVLGRLLAFYEHRVYVQSVIWNVNAFDQWGVELGKILAADIEPMLAGDKDSADAANGLAELIRHIRRLER